MTDKITSTTTDTNNLVKDTSVPDAQSVNTMHIDPVIPRVDELETPKAPKGDLDSYDESGPGIVHKGG